VLFVLVLASVPNPASARSSEVTDSNDVAPAYLDIVHAKVTDQVGTGRLTFLMELATAVPDEPVDSFVAYNWQLDTDDSPSSIEFFIIIRWRLGHWETLMWDQRPVNEGTGPLVETVISGVSFHGATVHVSIDAAAFDDPAILNWRAVTRNAPAPQPILDFAPNGGAWASLLR
jgi:hypothetical protein